MAILFASPGDDPDPWISGLRAALPDLEVRCWPEVGAPDDITYAVVWRPQPGLLASLPNLQAVFSLGAGVDPMMTDPTFPRETPLVRLVDSSLTENMTEYVVQQVLNAHRQAAVYREHQAAREWRPLPERLARERPVGILGMGQLGAAAGRALSGLHFPVMGWSRSAKTLEGIDCVHGADGFRSLLTRSEILVCLLPLTPQTRGILNADTFATLPRGGFVINAGRGGLLVEIHLLAAIESGHISGAALDVFDHEPLPAEHPFWAHPRIVVTPHVAAPTHLRTAMAAICEGIRRHRAGQPLSNVVDPDRGY